MSEIEKCEVLCANCHRLETWKKIMLKIIEAPNDTLKTNCEYVPIVTKKIVMQAREMFKIMYKNDGCGLAANQVGITKRFFVINCDPDGRKNAELVLINPVLRFAENVEYDVKEEGCLSLPGVAKKIKRAQRVLVSGLVITGRELRNTRPMAQSIHDMEFLGLEARCVQHETAHINGITLLEEPEVLEIEIENAKL